MMEKKGSIARRCVKKKYKVHKPAVGLVFTLALTLFFILGSNANAANSLVSGTVSAGSINATSIVVEAPFTGDDNNDSSIEVRWKECIASSYPGGNTMTFDRLPNFPSSPYTAVLTGLSPDTCYQIKVTYIDGDSISAGKNPQELKISSSWDNTLLHNVNRFWNSPSKWSSYGGWGIPNSKYGQFTCGTCHKPSETNIKRVKSTISAPSGSFPGSTVNFQSTWNTPNGFGDDSDAHTSSSKVCEVCHSITLHHRYDSSGQTDGRGHYNNADCVSCHPHALGFYNAAGSCDTCHGYPPVSSAGGGPTGLALPATGALGATPPADGGAHSQHVETRSMSCDVCHKGFSYTMPSNTLQMGFAVNSNSYPGWGSPAVTTGTLNVTNSLNSPYSWLQSSSGTQINEVASTDTTCSVYCHGGGTTGKAALTGGSISTPSWVSGSSQAACGACHGGTAFDNVADNPPTMGSHTAHASTDVTSPGLVCLDCHLTTPQNMSHVNGKVAWGLDTTMNIIGASATYNGSSSGTTGNLAPSATYGSCSTVYCHSNVQGADGIGAPSSYASPSWGSSGSVSCGTCHKGDGVQGNASIMDTGSHTKHVGAVGSGNYDRGCSTCHEGAGFGTARHTNYSIDMEFSGWSSKGQYSGDSGNNFSYDPGLGYGSCSSVYCHSAGENAVSPTYATPTWGSAATGACGTCHGATSVETPMTGAHVRHTKWDTSNNLVYKFRCYTCHKDTVTDAETAAVSTTGRSTYHVNEAKDVSLNVSNPVVGSWASFESGSAVCSTVYCHSAGKGGIVPDGQWPTIYGGTAYSTPVWSSSGFDCTTCHGKSGQTGNPSYVGYPDYGMEDRNADQGTPKANSHLATSHNKTSCSVCHYDTTRDGTHIYSNSHVNGTRDVSYDPNYWVSGTTAQWNTDMSCSNVTCHGVKSGVWGALGTCVDCHEASALLSGVHGRHWETSAGNATAPRPVYGNSSTAAYYKFMCDTCHDVEPDKHARGVVGQYLANVGFNISWLSGANSSYISSGMYVTGNGVAFDSRGQKITGNGSCSTVYCHSSGSIIAAAGPPWLTFSNIAWNATPGSPDCGVCHASPMVTNRHDVHATAYSFECIECHQATVSGSTTFADKSKHVNGVNDVAWRSGGMNVGGAAYSGPNCTNIYCHSQGQLNSAPYWTTANTPNVASVIWTNAQSGTCKGCHNSAAWSTFTVMNTNRHTAHVNNAAVIGVNYTCGICHSATVSGDTTITDVTKHVNKSVDVAWTALNAWASYSGTTTPGDAVGNCNNLYCHSIGNLWVTDGQLPGGANTKYTDPSWGGSAIGCNGCHGRTTSGSGPGTGAPDYTSGGAGDVSANSHQMHAVTAQKNCSACHYPVTTNGAAINGAQRSNHTNGNTQDVGFSTNWGSGHISLGGGYTTSTKSCSNNYCHSTAQGPWGSTNPVTYTSPQWGDNDSMTCGSCHKDMHTLNETPEDLQYGSHKRHTVDENFRCSTCHGSGYNWTSVKYPTHANGMIEVAFTSHVSSGGRTINASAGTYSQAANNPPANGYGTCSALVCHGRATRNWGINTELTLCEKCHGSARTALEESTFKDTQGNSGGVYVGSHVYHLSGSAGLSDPIYCTECHVVPSNLWDSLHMNGTPAEPSFPQPATVSSGTASELGTKRTLVDDSKSWSALGGYYLAFTSGLNNGRIVKITGWTTTSVTWSTASALFYDVLAGDGYQVKSGAVIANSGRIIGGISHEPMWASYSYGSARQCINTYCHAGIRHTNANGEDLGPQGAKPSPSWGDTGYAACNACHGNPPPYPHEQYSNNCRACHLHVSQSNQAFDNKSLHVNGSVEFTVDACLDCHSTLNNCKPGDPSCENKALIAGHGTHTDADYFLSWDANVTSTATGGTTKSLVDNGKSWTTDQWKGYYVRMLWGSNIYKMVRIEANDTNSLFWYTAGERHYTINSGDVYNIRFAKKISSGDYDDPSWIYDITFENGFPRYACGTCHPMDDATKRNNGIVDFDLDPTHSLFGTVKTKNKPGGWYTYTDSWGTTRYDWVDPVYRKTGQNVVCNGVYCHSNGYISPETNSYAFRQTPDWYSVTINSNGDIIVDPWASVDRCTQCHGNSPTMGWQTIGSSAHARHVVANHYGSVAAGSDVFTGTVGKLTLGWATNAVHGDANTATTFNCNICHNATVKDSYNDKNPVCGSCHNDVTAARKGTMDVYLWNTSHANGVVDVNFISPFYVKSKAQVRDDIQSVEELGNYWNRANGYKNADGSSYDWTTVSPSYTAGSCISVACHQGTPMEWRAQGPLLCAACHKGLPQ